MDVRQHIRTSARGDRGAVAVVTCLILVFALLPVTGLALTSYTRAGVAAEMVRSADSGALAGAAALSLINLAALPVRPDPVIFPVNPVVLGSTGTACTAALRALADDSTLSGMFATPRPGGVLTPACNAVYSPSPPFGGCLDGLFALLAPVPPSPLGAITAAVRNLLPAFLENGVQVTLTYQATGPLDALIPGATAVSPEPAVSTARRRFKRLLPPANATLTPVQAAVVTQMQSLLNQLRNEVTNPTGPGATTLGPTCTRAAKEFTEDLSDALKVTPSGAGQIDCLTNVILGISDPFNLLPPSVACTGDVFRAQLAPN